MTNAPFRIEMLGRFSLRAGDREISRFRTQKTAALLAYLTCYIDRPHPREILMDLFWADSPLQAARSNLSVALNSLRAQLEPYGIPRSSILISGRADVRLAPAAVSSDVAEFLAALRDEGAAANSESGAARLANALELYRGDLLPGFYDDWALEERDRLADLFRSALSRMIAILERAGRHEAALDYAHRLVRANPYDEPARHRMMQLYVALGRPAGALQQVEALERLLQSEEQEMTYAPLLELAGALRRTTPSRPNRAGAAGPEPDPSVPSHSHSAERLSSVTRLPSRFTQFFGREEELARLAMLAPASRLITLTGPGGTGKTRLSLEAAYSLREQFEGGVCFVPLAEVRDPLRIGMAIKDALKFAPHFREADLDQVTEFLNNRDLKTLLLLDNFEQVASGGANVVWTLLSRVASLSCLITSRRPLALPGEIEIPIAPLATPDITVSWSDDSALADALVASPSVALFVDRARAVRPEFRMTSVNAAAVAAICAKLDGIPLAIELAAAHTSALTPAQLLDRLSRRFALLELPNAGAGERHGSLWAAMDWSWQMLSPNLQRLLARLSVFHGGWCVEAAEAIRAFSAAGLSADEPLRASGADRSEDSPGESDLAESVVLERLAQLRGHSLIFAAESSTEIRLGMLETIREFAEAKLTAAGEREAAGTAHLHWYLDLVMKAEAGLRGPEQAAWLERLEEEHDNVRAALEFAAGAAALGQGDAGTAALRAKGLLLAGTLCRFWEMHGHITEGRSRLARALEAAGPETRTAEAGKALNGAGMLALRQGDYAAARSLFERSLSIHRELKDRGRESLNLNNLGIVANALSDNAAARSLYEQALTISRELGNRAAEALNLGNLGVIAFEERRLPEARICYEQALEIYRALGDRSGEAMVLHNLGNTHCVEGNYPEGVPLFRRALAIDRDLGARYAMALRLEAIASAAAAGGQSVRAARLYGAAEALRGEVGAPIPAHERENYDLDTAMARDGSGDVALFEAAWREGRSLPLADAVEFALSEEA